MFVLVVSHSVHTNCPTCTQTEEVFANVSKTVFAAQSSSIASCAPQGWFGCQPTRANLFAGIFESRRTTCGFATTLMLLYVCILVLTFLLVERKKCCLSFSGDEQLENIRWLELDDRQAKCLPPVDTTVESSFIRIVFSALVSLPSSACSTPPIWVTTGATTTTTSTTLSHSAMTGDVHQPAMTSSTTLDGASTTKMVDDSRNDIDSASSNSDAIIAGSVIIAILLIVIIVLIIVIINARRQISRKSVCVCLFSLSRFNSSFVNFVFLSVLQQGDIPAPSTNLSNKSIGTDVRARLCASKATCRDVRGRASGDVRHERRINDRIAASSVQLVDNDVRCAHKKSYQLFLTHIVFAQK